MMAEDSALRAFA